jgi:hypothetical protein
MSRGRAPQDMTKMSQPNAEPAYVFEDRHTPGDWHVQWTADDGGFETAICSGPRAHERAIIFAERVLRRLRRSRH